MAKRRYINTREQSFFGNYLYDQDVPQNHFLRLLNQLIEWERFTDRIIEIYNVLVFKVLNKIFALVAWQADPLTISLKVNPLKARILAVADASDAMASERPYRKAMSKDAAVEERRRNAGTQFDLTIAELFIEKVLGEKRQ